MDLADLVDPDEGTMEAPELPEPPVSFDPPEIALPPRLPEASGEDPTQEVETPNGRSGSGGRQRSAAGSEFDSAVISRVVDMSPSVMQMSPATEDEIVLTDSSWITASEVETTTEKGVTQNVTDEWADSAWADSAPESHPEQVQLLMELPTTQPSRPSVPDARSTVAGRYRVLERIGVGGMARIFRVQHLELGKHFALKIIHTALSGDTKVREMFYREARLASSLDHPNIVLLTDFGVDDNYGAFIVMEYLKGETLHARLRREGRLHPNVACEVALQVAEALMFIHGRDVVHCDIKSENVFLCNPPPEARRRTIVKLLDFGLSRQKIGSGRVSASEVGGTPAYMAPERINRLSPRPSMDIYSLGVLFYEMISGRLPFVGTMEEVLIAQLKQKPEPLSKPLSKPLAKRMKERVDDRVEVLVMKALEKDPDKRHKDAGAFTYELRTVMDMLGIGRRWGKHPVERLRGSGTASRVKSCELLVANCPLPLFMTDPRANLVLANKAFASFVNVEVDQVAGTPLKDTRLGRVCPEILEDLRNTVTTRKQTQRILSFPWRTAKQVSMMIWLTPEIIDNKVVGIICVIHPFTTSSAD
jgi:serine/threonine protein kinase